MPSTNKTPNYGLNLWAGSDRPTRADFNKDNQLIDAAIKAAEQAAILAAHPVGSYYWSDDSASPATLFGGVWSQIKDVFLLAAGDTYAAGTTGSEARHTLTEDEMPVHRHGISPDGATTNAMATYNFNDIVGGGDVALVNIKASGYSVIVGPYISPAGGGATHNNMPPYKAVYCWERTA